jgi:hypothetical protein
LNFSFRNLEEHELRAVLQTNLTIICKKLDNEQMLKYLHQKKAIGDVSMQNIKV